MVSRFKTYGFTPQKLRFWSSKAMVLRPETIAFPETKRPRRSGAHKLELLKLPIEKIK